MKRPLAGALLLAAVVAVGCELDEVAAPPSADVLVVEGVLRAGTPTQRILLHRSVEGRTVRGEAGASVRVTRTDGTAVTFPQVDVGVCLGGNSESWGADSDVVLQASCYAATAAGFVVPGATYDLAIETTAGESVRGRTTVPDRYRFTSPAVNLNPTTFDAVCRLAAEPFTMAWTRSEGAWSYLISMEVDNWPEDLPDLEQPFQLTSVSVSAADTTLLFPINIGLFQRGDLDSRIFTRLRTGLPAEVTATLAVVAADRNYTNAIRGGRFNPSGEVRIPGVVGNAIGVFGSVAPIRIFSPGRASTYPTCGAVLPPG